MSSSQPDRFRIVNVTLPSTGKIESEVLPVLVDQMTGLPPRLALRWLMRDRRVRVSEKTLSDDLRGAALLYAFWHDSMQADLDAEFGDGGQMSARQLEQLIEYLREGKGSSRGVRALSTTAQLAANIERFLVWLADSMDRGGSQYIRPEALAHYRQRLAYAFESLRTFRGRGQRRPPLNSAQDAELERLIGPALSSAGRPLVPLRFTDTNPWLPITRLRNWIAYRLGRELGLRRGEIGKLRIDDVDQVAGEGTISVRRRPHDSADIRRASNRPKVKTVERVLPISKLLATGIRQYMQTLLRDGGRRGAHTPYLLITSSGAPISGTSLDKVWSAPSARMSDRTMSWHVLRHTWAEETADALLSHNEGALDSDTISLGILRELGGWTPQSSTPFRYIQNALKKRGDEYLRRRNARFDRENPDG